MVTKRSIAQLAKPVSDDVRYAIDLLEHQYGASHYRDSGHTETRPTWIFELPRYGAEVGVPMNQRDLSLYMRNRTLDGKKLTDILAPELVTKVYPRDGKPAESIKSSPFLGPSAGNECVLLKLTRGDLEPLFDAFFAVSKGTPHVLTSGSTTSSTASAATTPCIDAEGFEALLERRSEVGRAGELLVALDEIERLRRAGCAQPERWVQRVAESDVGRGYDIDSTWPGHERCIEVKSTTSAGSPFFITDNERKVLGRLGTRAWLYRVIVGSDGAGDVACRLQDPMRSLPAEAFQPVVFRIDSQALT